MGISKKGKTIVILGSIGISIPILLSLVNEDVDIDKYLSHLSENSSYRLIKGNEVVQTGKLGSFSECLKNYKGMYEREIEKDTPNKYEKGLYKLVMFDDSVVNLSVSGGKAHSFDIKVNETLSYASAGPFAINCYLSNLEQ